MCSVLGFTCRPFGQSAGLTDQARRPDSLSSCHPIPRKSETYPITPPLTRSVSFPAKSVEQRVLPLRLGKECLRISGNRKASGALHDDENGPHIRAIKRNR